MSELMQDNAKVRTQLDWWKEEIRSGVKYRTVYGQAQDWRLYKNMYRGFWGKNVVPVNIIYSIGRSLIPQIYFRNPRVSVTSKKPGFSASAMVLEQVDNILIKTTGLKATIKSNILDTYLCGVGPGILGYDSEFGFSKKFIIDESFLDTGLTSFGKQGDLIEYTDTIDPGMPWYARCNPEDFVVPWGTRRLNEARWFAFRKMRTLRDIKEDPKYDNKANLAAPYRTVLEGSVDGRTQGAPLHSPDTPNDNQWVELWEIHDKRSRRVMVLSLDHERFLRDEEDSLQFDDLPARCLGFNEDPDFFWWSPDVRLIINQQLEINDVRTMAKAHRRVALLKCIADKNIPGEELDKLLDGDPKVVARLDVGSQGDIRKMVAFLQSHVPPDLASAAMECREDIREIIGFSRNQQGSFEAPSGRRTATEVNVVRAAAMLRVDERRDATADHLESIISGYNKIIFDNWGENRIVQIIGPDAKGYWVQFKGSDIKGDYTYNINPEEQTPQDQQSRRADAEVFMTIAQKTPGINMGYALQQWARQFDWIDPRQLLPKEGAGNNPDQPLPFSDFASRMGQLESAFPGLG